jgi:hypothetical protein
MKNSQRPAGPGRNITERRDAATAREELEELPGDTPTGTARPTDGQPAQNATRHAERNAHARAPGTDANSRSRQR